MIIPLPILIFIGIIWSAYTHVTASIGGHPLSVSLGLLILVVLILALVALILAIARSLIQDARPPRHLAGQP